MHFVVLYIIKDTVNRTGLYPHVTNIGLRKAIQSHMCTVQLVFGHNVGGCRPIHHP